MELSKRALAIVNLSLLSVRLACGQPPEPLLRFDVASVRPDQSDTGVDTVKLAKGEVTIRNVSLKRLVAMAWGIPESRAYLLSGPEWLDTERFDISARYPQGIPDPDALVMLRNLLIERFGLAIHRETRQFAGYAMLVARTGSRLTPTARPNPFAMFRALPGQAAGQSASMPDLADRLSRPPFQLDRPVVTGIAGRYDLTLDWSPISDQTENATGPSIFTAMEEQLGLRLEPRKLPLEVLIVDRANKTSTEN